MGLDLLLWLCFSLSVLLLPREASILRSVVGAAAAALHPQHVESHGAVGLAVIAYDLWQRKQNYICRKTTKCWCLTLNSKCCVILRSYFDCCILVFRRHWCLGNLLTYLFPVFFHVPDRVHTQRTAIRTGRKTKTHSPTKVFHHINIQERKFTLIRTHVKQIKYRQCTYLILTMSLKQVLQKMGLLQVRWCSI